jgi:hypothetical protein
MKRFILAWALIVSLMLGVGMGATLEKGSPWLDGDAHYLKHIDRAIDVAGEGGVNLTDPTILIPMLVLRGTLNDDNPLHLEKFTDLCATYASFIIAQDGWEE